MENAQDQARAVARRLGGKPAPYAAVPWFWSDQGDLKLQIAGVADRVDRWVVLGEGRALTALGLHAGRAVVAESVNRPGDHMAFRRLLAEGAAPTERQVEAPRFDLRALAGRPARG